MSATSDSLTEVGSREMEPVLDALAEINVQLRQIVQASKTVIIKLETHTRSASAFEEVELETKNQSILANMIRTGEAIGQMNFEISELLRKGRASGALPGGLRNRVRLKLVKEDLRQ